MLAQVITDTLIFIIIIIIVNVVFKLLSLVVKLRDELVKWKVMQINSIFVSEKYLLRPYFR